MSEPFALGLLAVSGLAVLSGSGLLAVRPLASAWLAFPIGGAAYGVVALFDVGFTRSLDTTVALGWTIVLALGYAAVTPRPSRRALAIAGSGATALLVVAGFLALFNPTRLTPDSIWYLIAARNLETGGPPWVMIARELPKRQFLYPALQALPAEPTGYLEAAGPVYLLSVVLLAAWVVHVGSEELSGPVRAGAAVVTVGLLLSSNRFLFDGFYLNSHVLVAAYVMIGAAAVWRVSSMEGEAWSVPMALAMSSLVLLRPETPLVALALVWLLAAARPRRGLPLVMAATAAATGLWYLSILWPFGPQGSRVAIDAPVFGTVAAVAATSATVMLGRRVLGAVRLARHGATAGLALVLVVFALREPDLLATAIDVAGQNLFFGEGLWGATWWVLAVGYVLTVWSDERLWPFRRAVEAFLVIHLLSAFLRGSPWRLGPGDSGNRIMAHVLPVAVVAVVLGALSLLQKPAGRGSVAA